MSLIRDQRIQTFEFSREAKGISFALFFNLRNLESLSECCSSSLSESKGEMVREFVSKRDVGFSFIDPNSIYFMELENLRSLHVRYEKWHAGFARTFGEVGMSNPLDALGSFGALLQSWEL